MRSTCFYKNLENFQCRLTFPFVSPIPYSYLSLFGTPSLPLRLLNNKYVSAYVYSFFQTRINKSDPPVVATAQTVNYDKTIRNFSIYPSIRVNRASFHEPRVLLLRTNLVGATPFTSALTLPVLSSSPSSTDATLYYQKSVYSSS